MRTTQKMSTDARRHCLTCITQVLVEGSSPDKSLFLEQDDDDDDERQAWILQSVKRPLTCDCSVRFGQTDLRGRCRVAGSNGGGRRRLQAPVGFGGSRPQLELTQKPSMLKVIFKPHLSFKIYQKDVIAFCNSKLLKILYV